MDFKENVVTLAATREASDTVNKFLWLSGSRTQSTPVPLNPSFISNVARLFTRHAPRHRYYAMMLIGAQLAVYTRQPGCSAAGTEDVKLHVLLAI